MSIGELVLLAIGLAMDAFAVAICCGLRLRQPRWKDIAVVGLYFGIFQGIMPLIGYGIAVQFSDQIVAYNHWVAFGLLGFLGAKMIRESIKSLRRDCDFSVEHTLGFRILLPMAIATSIDALAVGVSFAVLEVAIFPAALLIGAITFALSCIGVKIGHMFGSKYKAKAEFAGGVILILMGIKILLEHTGIL